MVAILGKLQRTRSGSAELESGMAFAIEGGICYSLRVADEQWSLPVAMWPAPRGKWEAG
jgi:hypothetical protein